MSLTQHNVEDYVSELFATKNPYNKYYSPENLNRIVSRVTSFGIHPSATAVKRAILELVEEGQIERTDGKDEADDEREAGQAAEERDRQLALAKPLTQADAAVYASLSLGEIAHRFNSDRVWRFRYEAACRLWGFRLPVGLSIATEPSKEESPQIPADILEFIHKAETGKISTYDLRRKYLSDRRFRDAYDAWAGLGSTQPRAAR